MGVEYIPRAICDRCGAKCSSVSQRVVREDLRGEFEVKHLDFEIKAYHYTELFLRTRDPRFKYNTDKMILCGKCLHALGEWLKNENGEQTSGGAE